MRYTTYLDQSKNTEKWSQINGHKISVKELLFSRQVISDYNPMDCCTPGFPVTVSQNLPKFMSITLMMPISHLILCYPLLLMPSIFPSIRVFSSESALCIRWPNYWNFNFSISSSNAYSGLISSKIDWFDLLAVQGTLQSQHHSSKAINSLALYLLYGLKE